MAKWNSVDDVIDFIEANAPVESEKFPICKAPYDLVEPAVRELKARGRFLDLEVYDIRGTKKMWNSEEGTNLELARKATKALVKKLQDEQSNKTLAQILTEITKENFYKTPINKYQTTLGGMINHVYEGSPYLALKDLINNSEEFSEYRDIQPYDMKMAPMETWNKSDGNKNYELARHATKTLIQKLQQEQPNKTLTRILAEITHDSFSKHTINKYQTTLGGMIANVYEDSPYFALKDLIDNDKELVEFRDIQPYDLLSAPNNTWNKEDGSKDYKLARQATKTLVKRLQKEEPDKSLERILAEITQETFFKHPINKYGTTLCGMINSVYKNSPYAALKDLIDNDNEYRDYRDIQPYDMQKSPLNTWNKLDGTKNYELARQATKTLIQKLQQEQPNKTLAQILTEITKENFYKTPINKYQTTLGGMIHHVYEHSPYLAFKDLCEHDLEFRPYLPLLEQRMRRAA